MRFHDMGYLTVLVGWTTDDSMPRTIMIVMTSLTTEIISLNHVIMMVVGKHISISRQG